MGNDFGLFGKIYEKGEIVCCQGDPGDEMYIIQSGAVEVSSRRDDHKVVLTILEKEDFFGEMALIAGGPRMASTKARSPVRLRSVSREDMLTGIRSDPETGLFFLRILIDRLRVITRALEEPNRSLNTLRQAVLPKSKASSKISIGFSSMSSCGGCAAMLVRSPDELGRITDNVRVRCCPMLMDQEQILETDIAVVDGAIARGKTK
jgi:CRP-like cAMP-binding protein